MTYHERTINFCTINFCDIAATCASPVRRELPRRAAIAEFGR